MKTGEWDVLLPGQNRVLTLYGRYSMRDLNKASFLKCNNTTNYPISYRLNGMAVIDIRGPNQYLYNVNWFVGLPFDVEFDGSSKAGAELDFLLQPPSNGNSIHYFELKNKRTDCSYIPVHNFEGNTEDYKVIILKLIWSISYG